MKTKTFEERNQEIFASCENLLEYQNKLEEMMDDVVATDESLWSAGNGKLWLNEYRFGHNIAEAAKSWKQSHGETLEDFRERMTDWYYTHSEKKEED